MNVWWTRASCLAMTLCCACSGELPSPSRVDKLRLFALSAFEPEVTMGEPITVRAMWTDASPLTGRDVFFTWKLCDAVRTREARRCLLPTEGAELVSGVDGLRHDALTLDAMQLEGGVDPVHGYFVLMAMCPDQPPVYDLALGQYVCPSEVNVENAKREGVQAFRTLGVRSSGARNHNPAFERVTFGDRDVAEGAHVVTARCGTSDAGACAEVPLEVIATESSIEVRDDGMSESMLVSFFATDGTFSRPRAIGMSDDPRGVNGTLSAGWKPPSRAGAVNAWVVMRDGRGGDIVRAFVIDVQ